MVIQQIQPVFPHRRSALQLGARRRAFTFLEVLFAVILLGVGFIMLAALFPVAIKENTEAANETQGEIICHDGASLTQSLASNLMLPPQVDTNGNPFVVPYTLFTNTPNANGQFNIVGESQFLTADHRFGWVGFYLRPTSFSAQGVFVPSPYAQVYIFAVKNPNLIKPDVTNLPVPIPYAGTTATFSYVGGTNGTQSTVTFTNPPTSVCEDAYLLVQQTISTSINGSLTNPGGTLEAGRILRIGGLIGSTTTTSTYYLQPGMDLQPYNPSTAQGVPEAPAATVPCWLVGAGSNNPPVGCQDLAVMSTFIRVNN